MYTLDFAVTSTQYAEWLVWMPAAWNAGTVTAQFVWEAPGTNTGNVIWSLAGTCVADNAVMDVAYANPQTATDAHISDATGMRCQVTGATNALTITGAAASSHTMFRVTRTSGDGFTGTASLVSVIISYTVA